MKKHIFLFCLLLSVVCFSQNDAETVGQLAKDFKTHYNAAEYGKVHELFDTTLKTYHSMEQLTALLDTVRSNYGRIRQLAYVGKNNAAHLYRATFKKGSSDMAFTVNQKHEISGFFIPTNPMDSAAILERNHTKMIFPFKEEAFVFWGGETIEINYHMADINQQYAYDILMVANGAPYQGDPTKNESYFVFGKEIIAPCAAKVVKVIDGIKDNAPGEVNKKALTGNTLILRTNKNEYLLLAHLKYNSLSVQEGDSVKQGQVLAQCGNSGNTTEAHLHLQLQNTTDILNTVGAKLYFDELLVNGHLKKDYMPIKEDFVKNSKNVSH